MCFKDVMSMIEDVHKQTVHDKLVYSDFLSRLRDRLAVICVQLNTMEDSFDANHVPVYVSRADYVATVCFSACEELSRILGEIDKLLSEPEASEDSDNEND